VNQYGSIPLPLAWIAVAWLLVAVTACGAETSTPASDPPGALVRLQRGGDATSLPGDFTVFSNGGLQLYLGDRGALRKTVPPADLAGLQAALNDLTVSTLADTYPATLPTGAGDTLTIYGARRRTIRYDPSSPDLPPVLQRLIGAVCDPRMHPQRACARSGRALRAQDRAKPTIGQTLLLEMFTLSPRLFTLVSRCVHGPMVESCCRVAKLYHVGRHRLAGTDDHHPAPGPRDEWSGRGAHRDKDGCLSAGAALSSTTPGAVTPMGHGKKGIRGHYAHATIKAMREALETRNDRSLTQAVRNLR